MIERRYTPPLDAYINTRISDIAGLVSSALITACPHVLNHLRALWHDVLVMLHRQTLIGTPGLVGRLRAEEDQQAAGRRCLEMAAENDLAWADRRQVVLQRQPSAAQVAMGQQVPQTAGLLTSMLRVVAVGLMGQLLPRPQQQREATVVVVVRLHLWRRTR